MVKIRKTASVENGIMQVLNILSDEEILEAIKNLEDKIMKIKITVDQK